MKGADERCGMSSTNHQMDHRSLTARAAQHIDASRLSLRRGFLDVKTPLWALVEVQMTSEQQREFLKARIAAAEAERAQIRQQIGRINNKNLTYAINTKPQFRQKLRMGRMKNAQALNRFVELGQQIQDMQMKIRALPRPSKRPSDAGSGTPQDLLSAQSTEMTG